MTQILADSSAIQLTAENFFGAGFPIQSHSDWLRHQAALKKVPEFVEKIRKLEEGLKILTKA